MSSVSVECNTSVKQRKGGAQYSEVDIAYQILSQDTLWLFNPTNAEHVFQRRQIPATLKAFTIRLSSKMYCCAVVLSAMSAFVSQFNGARVPDLLPKRVKYKPKIQYGNI